MLPQLPAPAAPACTTPARTPGGPRLWVLRAGLCPCSPTAADHTGHFLSASVIEWQRGKKLNNLLFYTERPKAMGSLCYRKTLGRAEASRALQSDLLLTQEGVRGPSTAPAALRGPGSRAELPLELIPHLNGTPILCRK